MKIEANKFVTLSYTLTVDGEVVEQVTAEKPLGFVYGTGNLLPKFEENLTDLEVGGKFEFTLTPEDSYGEYIQDAIVTLPKDIFKVDGEINEEMLTIGNMLPMMDNQGNRLMGVVKENKEAEVVMDFNHPMAGKVLNFSGEVVEVRTATPEEIAGTMPGAAGGCGCGCDGESKDGCECGDGCESSCCS